MKFSSVFHVFLDSLVFPEFPLIFQFSIECCESCFLSMTLIIIENNLFQLLLLESYQKQALERKATRTTTKNSKNNNDKKTKTTNNRENREVAATLFPTLLPNLIALIYVMIFH